MKVNYKSLIIIHAMSGVIEINHLEAKMED